MEQLQALEQLRSVVDILGFPLTLRMLAGIANQRLDTAEASGVDTGMGDEWSALRDIAATITAAADSLCGESAR